VHVPTESNSYKCIDANSPKTFGQLIADGLLLDPIASASTPQRLIIRGSVIVDYNNSGWPDEYVFAPGSEIVMVSNTGSMIINPGKTLHLNNSSVHGCIFLWKEILVKAGGSLKVDNSSEIKDAFTAIKAEPGSSLSVMNSQFSGNFVSMELGDKNATSVGVVTILSGGAISGNVFEGVDILKPRL
jgi:hypothetical protein